MKEKVLITGASGFVGFHLIQEALLLELEVFAAIRPSSNVEHLKGMNLHFLNIDFSNKESIQRIFQEHQFDYIIHAAGLTRARTYEEYDLANVQSTINLAAVSSIFPIKKFVFLSSLAALGPIAFEEIQLIKEDHLPNPVTNYGRSKMNAESGLIQFEELPLVTLRPTAIYGPREKDLLIMFKTLNRGLEPYIGKGSQWLSFIYVKDLTALVFKALFSNSGVHKIYNVSDGHSYSRYDLAKAVKKTLGKKTMKFHVPMPVVKKIAGILESFSKNKAPVLNIEKLNELAAENWNCSIEKVQKDLGFLPKYNLESGIEETLQWYKQNKWL